MLVPSLTPTRTAQTPPQPSSPREVPGGRGWGMCASDPMREAHSADRVLHPRQAPGGLIQPTVLPDRPLRRVQVEEEVSRGPRLDSPVGPGNHQCPLDTGHPETTLAAGRHLAAHALFRSPARDLEAWPTWALL